MVQIIEATCTFSLDVYCWKQTNIHVFSEMNVHVPNLHGFKNS